jgi:ribosomal protein S18 acetylase RimI-like enzyme
MADDLASICACMQPEQWAADNQMSRYQPAFLQAFLESGGILLLAKDGEQIAGAAIAYCLLHPDGAGSLYVHELDTHPKYRRQGVATAIMQALMALARQHQLTEVWLGAETAHEAANAFYRTLGPGDTEAAILYFYPVR